MKTKMIFIFIDGFGIGEENEDKNPIVSAHAPNIKGILGSGAVMPTDACLDLAGLPQSATGQTAIFTGVNASKVLGRHLHGQPTETLKKLIMKDNLFKELIKRGFKVTNANVYRDEYLQKMFVSSDRRHRPSVSSVMVMSAGLRFRNIEDYQKGMGVYHDISGQILIDSGYDAQLTTPEEAAERLYAISREYDFTLYEHFMTDIIGHKMDMALAVKEIELLDAFLGHLLKLVNPKEDTVFITSDHGNIEDISVKTHTFNRVPTVVLGKLPEGSALKIETLTDILPEILKLFDAGDRPSGGE